MKISNSVQQYTEAFYDCFHRERFSPISYESMDWVGLSALKEKYRKVNKTISNEEQESFKVVKTRAPFEDEIVTEGMFPQIWGSTSLGFGGWGGSKITEAYTVVFSHAGEYCVYFGGKFAYMIKRPNEMFFDDFKKYKMKPVLDSGLYENQTY